MVEARPGQAEPPAAVLITRPEPGAGETAARIAAMGLTAIVAPFLEIRPVACRLPRAGQIAAILMASGNAAGPLAALTASADAAELSLTLTAIGDAAGPLASLTASGNSAEPLARSLRGVPVLTVGEATARRARLAGFTDVVSADGDAAALAALVRARLPPASGTLLLAAGRGQSLALAADLRVSGYRVARRVVYAAAPVAALPEAARAALLAGHPLTVLFFSTETAACFMRLVRAAGLTRMLRGRDAITIGDQVGVALKGGHWSRVRVAGKPTQDEMLALLR